MSGLSRRERRALAALSEHLVASDPELAEALSRPAAAARSSWAARLGAAMLLVGVVVLTTGLLGGSAGVGALGALLVITSWMPPRIAAPDDPPAGTGS